MSKRNKKKQKEKLPSPSKQPQKDPDLPLVETKPSSSSFNWKVWQKIPVPNVRKILPTKLPFTKKKVQEEVKKEVNPFEIAITSSHQIRENIKTEEEVKIKQSRLKKIVESIKPTKSEKKIEVPVVEELQSNSSSTTPLEPMFDPKAKFGKFNIRFKEFLEKVKIKRPFGGWPLQFLYFMIAECSRMYRYYSDLEREISKKESK